MSTIITLLPGWIIAILLFGVLSGCAWLGSRLRQRLQFNPEIAYAGSAVSLLALMVGFTFSLALSRYDDRRDLAVEEAAAIHAIWHRLPLLPDPARTKMAKLTRGYADQRLSYFTFGIDKDKALRADAAADAMAERMWAIVRGLGEAGVEPIVTRMLMDNLTRIDDAAWRREAMAREHIPFLVIDLLVIFSAMTAVSMGFAAPKNGRFHPTLLIFFALNAAAIMLVLDLDQPRSGLVRVSQRPMVEVSAIMADDAREAARAAAATPDP